MSKTDPTKDETPVPTGDMLEAWEKTQEPEKKEESKDEPEEKEEDDEKKDDPKPEEEEEESDDLKLDDKKEDEDLESWKERKEKGVQKIVERFKAKEKTLESELASIEETKTKAKVYLDHKEEIDKGLSWLAWATKPENVDEAIEQLKARVHGDDYVPEVDSEKQLKSALEKKMAGEISALRQELAEIKKPIEDESKAKQSREAVKQKAEDTYEEVALTIEGTCNGYRLEKEHYQKALEAYPALDGADAVKLYLHSAIQKHTAQLAAKPKKKEIVDDSTKKDAEVPKDGDMVAQYEYLKATGALKG